MSKAAIVVILSVCLAVSGCAVNRQNMHLSSQELQSPATSDLKRSDLLEVTMNSGVVRRVRLNRVEAGSLFGREVGSYKDPSAGKWGDVSIPLADIKSIEVLRTGIKVTEGREIVKGVWIGLAVGVALLYGVRLAVCGKHGDACSGDD